MDLAQICAVKVGASVTRGDAEEQGHPGLQLGHRAWLDAASGSRMLSAMSAGFGSGFCAEASDSCTVMAPGCRQEGTRQTACGAPLVFALLRPFIGVFVCCPRKRGKPSLPDSTTTWRFIPPAQGVWWTHCPHRPEAAKYLLLQRYRGLC